MRVPAIALVLIVAAVCAAWPALASVHPGSGIVGDEKGNVFVADINTGLWRIDTDGKLTQVHREAGHGLALDAGGASPVWTSRSRTIGPGGSRGGRRPAKSRP